MKFLRTLIVLFCVAFSASANAAPGDLVATLSVAGAPPGTTYALTNNPNGYFAISNGNQLIEAINTPAGNYSVGIRATAPGFSVTQQFVLNYSPAGPPPGVFSIGINVSGAQDSYTNFPTSTEVNYYANSKGIKRFRLPIGWWGANWQSGVQTNGFTGIQSQGINTTIDSTYVGAMISLINSVSGGKFLIDIHTFAVGPGLAGNFQPTSITASGNIATVTAAASANLVNGATVVINGACDGTTSCGPYNGLFTVSNVTPTTFQYTMGSTPAASPATRQSSSNPIIAGEQASLGSARLPCSAFGNVWGQISAAFMGNANVQGYDLINEPPNGFDSGILQTCEQAAINAIRANGDTKPIYIEGVNYSAVWDWVSGGSNPFNNSNLYQLTDSANNLLFSGHGYFDRDGSGTHFCYATESTTPGEAPPGDNTGPNIGIERLAPFIAWGAAHHVRLHYGEHATSNDGVAIGCANNYAAWNLIETNTLAYLQANNVETDVWGGGDFSTTYGFNLKPVSVSVPGANDFTSHGLQATQWVAIDQYSGFAGSQPLAYSFTPPSSNFSPSGTPSGNFTVQYNGVVPSGGTIITPHDYLADGVTPASGTFTPTSITLSAGSQNAVATFTYTPSQTSTFQIATTNNKGWFDPPPIGYTSTPNDYATALNQSSVIALRRIIPSYIGPALTLISPSDGSQHTFSFNNNGDLPRQAIQNIANTRSYQIARIYSQNGNSAADYFPIQQNAILTPSLANPPTLNLVNSTGYPEVNVAAGQWMGTAAASNGRGLLTLISRATGSNVLVSQDNFSEQFRLGSGGFSVFPNGGGGTGCGIGSIASYATVAGTYSNLYSTNNVNCYNGGSSVSSASVAGFTFAPAFGVGDTFINGFRFGGQNYSGVWQSEVITFDELSSGVLSTIASHDATYYSTPLPDTLGPLNPNIAGTGASGVTVGLTSTPFSGATITDANSGSPTDSVTITLTGSAGGTLSGSGISGSGPYTISAASAASVTATLRAAVYTPAGGAATTETMALLVTSSAGTTSNDSSTVVTVHSATNPVIANLPSTQFTVLSHFMPPFWIGPNGAGQIGVVVTDANGGTVTDSVTLTITGDAGATLTGTGITGSNPYTIASASAASVTTTLQGLQYASTSSAGTVGTLAITVNSSAGTSASGSTAITVDNVVAETPFAAPACTFTPPTWVKGVNISDASGHYPAEPSNGQNRFSYIYPQSAELSYFAGKGMTAIRLPTTAIRLQPFPYQPLDPVSITRVQDGFVGRVDEQAVNAYATLGTQTNLTAIKAVLDQACSLNMYVLLEPHDYGIIYDNRIGGAGRAIGVDAEGTAMFRDWWKRVVTKFQYYPNIIFPEENEPAAQSAAQWQAAAALVTSDIAAITTSHLVMLQGVGYDSCLGWSSDGNATAWTGYSAPAGLSVVYECHQYLDHTAQGISPVCDGTGSSRLTTFVNWINANSLKGFIGEFGWSSQSSCMTSATTGDGPTFLAYLSANEPAIIGWTWWLGGSSAFEGTWQAPAAALASTVVPVGYPSGPFTDAPQMQTLVNNLP